MASIVRRYPKTATLAAAATCFICLPVLLPLLLISSPFIFFTSLFSFCLMTFFTSLLRFSLSVHRRIIGNNKKRIRIPEGVGGLESADVDAQTREEGILKESRVHEYLEDQLKNLNVKADFERGESGEDPLPCSFSIGPLESLDAALQQS